MPIHNTPEESYNIKNSHKNTISRIDIILNTLESASDYARLSAVKQIKRKSEKRVRRPVGLPLTLNERLTKGIRYLENKIMKIETNMIGKTGNSLDDLLLQRAGLQKYLTTLVDNKT